MSASTGSGDVLPVAPRAILGAAMAVLPGVGLLLLVGVPMEQGRETP